MARRTSNAGRKRTATRKKTSPVLVAASALLVVGGCLGLLLALVSFGTADAMAIAASIVLALGSILDLAAGFLALKGNLRRATQCGWIIAAIGVFGLANGLIQGIQFAEAAPIVSAFAQIALPCLFMIGLFHQNRLQSARS